jgi:hypothetical protein
VMAIRASRPGITAATRILGTMAFLFVVMLLLTAVFVS